MSADTESHGNTAEFVHVFQPGVGAGNQNTLLLLHGTGGNERDLIPLGQMLDPNAALLSVRGRVLENGMPRFFRRLAEGVLDEADVETRSRELAQFVTSASERYGFSRESLAAVGFSNGANVASAMLWDGAEKAPFTRAILIRPMLPYRERVVGKLTGCSILVAAGARDPLVSREQVDLLESKLRAAGADVAVARHDAGHNLVQEDVAAARTWLVTRKPN